MEQYRVPEISIFTIYSQGVLLKAVFIRVLGYVYIVISFRSCMSNKVMHTPICVHTHFVRFKVVLL